MSPTCSGTDKDGKPCPCLRVKLKPDQKEDEPTVCFNCRHWDTAHPSQPFDIKNLIGSYQVASEGKAKASSSDALRESRQGFRQQSGSKSRADNEDDLAGLIGKNRKGKGKDKVGFFVISQVIHCSDTLWCKVQPIAKSTRIGNIVVLPTGLDENYEPIDTRAPRSLEIHTFSAYGLAKLSSKLDQGYRFFPDWAATDVERWLQSLMPDVFAYLDEEWARLYQTPRKEEFLWRLLVKSGNQLKLVTTNPITGKELDMFRSCKGKAWHEQTLYLGACLFTSLDLC